MSETLKEFIQFISDDPLMLGLCCAIAFLIIIFILILCFGGRKKKTKKAEETIENTNALLETQSIDDEPLKSTQEFTLNEIEEENKPVETFKDEEIDAKTAPITISEAMQLKNDRQEEAIQIPVVEEKEPEPLEFPKLEINEPVIEEPTLEPTPTPIEPVLPEITKTARELENTTVMQPFSSVYANPTDELPKPTENFSNTEIIRHIPKIEETVEQPVVQEPVTDEEENLDDIELPKLNTGDNTSVINTLTGESFDIK